MPTILVGGAATDVDRHPNECPICHSRIAPKFVSARYGGRKHGLGPNPRPGIEVLYTCPADICDQGFIGYFAPKAAFPFVYTKSLPVIPIQPPFEQSILTISASYCQIYTEASAAEDYGLKQICGMGYRKSLEFLIKDYLIVRFPNEEASIKSLMLGRCIDNYVTDEKIKEVSKRAAWLGNDETHYERRWVDKDLKDLKVLIKLAVHWIEAEHLTAEFMQSMPTP